MTIPFKAIAVDMDGTFLDSNKNYDHTKFQKILGEIKQRKLHFIVSSGRPLARLKLDFKDFLDQIDIVAENGAVLFRDGHIFSTRFFTDKTVKKLIKFIQENYPQMEIMASGVDYSYLLVSSSSNFKQQMNYYYPNQVELKSFNQMPTNARITKLTLWSDQSTSTLAKEFNRDFSERIHVTTSGFKFTDVLPYGVNKADGLKYFLRYFDLSGDDLIAFGDGMNDAEMMKLAKFSYAMANADKDLKQITKYEAPSNDENGVFKVLENYLKQD